VSLSEEQPYAPLYTFDMIFATVMEVLAGIVGEDYVVDMQIEAETRLESDLELESIEVVQLAEELIARYEGRVDFVSWFASMELDELIELSVGELVEFIFESLDADPA
jgi:acyl carrier protein